MNNILVITIDSLRADYSRLSDDNGQLKVKDTSKDGISFKNAFATGPGTTPTFPALLTGTYGLSYGGLGALSKERPRVAKILNREGFSTAGFHSNPFLSRFFNYEVGFDEFKDYQNPLMGVATKLFPRGIEISNPKLEKLDETLHLTDTIKKGYRLVKGKQRPYVEADIITDDAITWMKDVQEPFFCWAHYMDVHHPCHPPEEYREEYGVATIDRGRVSDLYSKMTQNPDGLSESEVEKLLLLYRAAIDYVLDEIRRIISFLKESGQYDDTLVVITSDHGELFGDHGEFGKPERMYDELLHVPLVVLNGPEYLADAANDLVSLIDIPPLIHDALGLDVPEFYEGQRPGVDDPREFVMAEHEVESDGIIGVRSKDWLYEADEIRGEERLYHIVDGSLQEVPPDEHPEVDFLRETAMDRLETLDVHDHSIGKDIGEDLEEDVQSRLKDLGYL